MIQRNSNNNYLGNSINSENNNLKSQREYLRNVITKRNRT